eukprot:1158208-Pelagomonas_calceolata.AAC.19
MEPIKSEDKDSYRKAAFHKFPTNRQLHVAQRSHVPATKHVGNRCSYKNCTCTHAANGRAGSHLRAWHGHHDNRAKEHKTGSHLNGITIVTKMFIIVLPALMQPKGEQVAIRGHNVATKVALSIAVKAVTRSQNHTLEKKSQCVCKRARDYGNEPKLTGAHSESKQSFFLHAKV